MRESVASIVDTDVFSVLYLKPGARDPRTTDWLEQLAGRRVVIAFQTRAEVLAGARIRGWGERRTEETLRALDRTPTIYPDGDVVEAYASLVAACQRIGHALHDKRHTGDRWIAACAIAKRLDLVAGDSIYEGAPDLKLGTHG